MDNLSFQPHSQVDMYFDVLESTFNVETQRRKERRDETRRDVK